MPSLSDVDEIVHEPSPEFVESTNVAAFMREYGIDDYDELIARTTREIEGEPNSGIDWFWDEVVEYLDIDFFEPYDTVRDDSDGPQFTDWYPGGRINAAHNVVDRQAADEASREDTAIIWESEPGEVRQMSFEKLATETGRVANTLDDRGVDPGDTVALYMPMVTEVVSILYGCLAAGAIAVPIFSGFGTDAVATRIEDADPDVLFTADGFYRRGEPVALKPTADDALAQTGGVETVIVHDRLGSRNDGGLDLSWTDGRDEWWDDAVMSADDEYETRSLPADHPAMVLYSSGTTGKPKGIVQTHAGALVQSAKEIYFGFDHQPDDRFFWLSDIGWMMGPWTLLGNHTFGGTVVLYEGAPDHPEPDRLWELIDRHDVTTFGISPTAIRALRKHGEEWLDGHDLSSLRLLGSTGEPWDPESWRWFYERVGGGECPIINISGGTEIMGCFLMPMPIQRLKPCTLGGPGLGMDIDIVDSAGDSIADEHERGYLVARDSCPSMTNSLWSGDERYIEEYWSTWEGLWDHGDWAQIDEDGFWFLHGRADDALNVAGRKVGPAEVEGALIDHDAVNQAAAVGVPDETTGQAVVAYVVLDADAEPSEELERELRERVGVELGKPFRPREILFVEEFPKTQSGKIVRRAIAAAYTGEDLGDLESVENPEAIDAIEAAR
ncbi:AMP-binding protein [Natranaeroarchaeum sulfidigenes]|uniref:acetate--CoA ligase n=1 Tax=Natranaeroarchaeum sulfidigenes TaxID=2784880 RepID=A0A897MQL0_9EURY|nr:AMP-binding protein [Natranaeroarchaeum sulfidigenes]QSG02268.1 Acyl-coenzyme A synthetase/AMP-(fatty) acid ligase [Natranaeroarchaeum sulfidigenes]